MATIFENDDVVIQSFEGCNIQVGSAASGGPEWCPAYCCLNGQLIVDIDETYDVKHDEDGYPIDWERVEGTHTFTVLGGDPECILLNGAFAGRRPKRRIRVRLSAEALQGIFPCNPYSYEEEYC